MKPDNASQDFAFLCLCPSGDTQSWLVHWGAGLMVKVDDAGHTVATVRLPSTIRIAAGAVDFLIRHLRCDFLFAQHQTQRLGVRA